MIEVGTRVCYTRNHRDWLQEAGKWVKAQNRVTFLGTVVDREGEVVDVDWDAGSPWPRKHGGVIPHMPTTHLAQNLEEDIS